MGQIEDAMQKSTFQEQQSIVEPLLSRWVGYGLVLLAGTAWACLGLFFRRLQMLEFPALFIAFDRALLAGVTLVLFSAVRRPADLRLRWRDLPLFATYGLGIAAFFLVYIRAVAAGSVALAAVLLYTAPIWIVLFARVRWGEPLTRVKLAALTSAVVGSACIALGSAQLSGSWLAIGLGLLSGLAYALYSLFSNEGLQRGYAPTTVVLYAMLFAAVFLLPLQQWATVVRAWHTPAAWPALVGVALVSTVLAPVCYAAGQRRIGASNAGILATVEPVVAALLAWVLLGEQLAVMQLVGGACVLAAVLLLARHPAPAHIVAAEEVAHE